MSEEQELTLDLVRLEFGQSGEDRTWAEYKDLSLSRKETGTEKLETSSLHGF